MSNNYNCLGYVQVTFFPPNIITLPQTGTLFAFRCSVFMGNPCAIKQMRKPGILLDDCIGKSYLLIVDSMHSNKNRKFDDGTGKFQGTCCFEEKAKT